MTDVQQRVEFLEAAAAVDKAKVRQAMALDSFINKESGIKPLLAELTPDYRFQNAAFETCDGAEAYRDFVSRYAQRVDFSLHFLTGSVTSIDPALERAVGDWVLWQPFSLDGKPWILAGRSHDEFENHGQGWRLSATTVTAEVLAPWAVGWGRELISPEWHWQPQTTITDGEK